MLRLVLVLVVLGAAVYLTVRIAQRGGLEGLRPSGGSSGRPAAPRRPRPPSRPARPVAPDDDDDFLRDLDRRRLHGDDPDARPEA